MAKKIIVVDSAVMASLSDSSEDVDYFHRKSKEIAKTIGLKDFDTFLQLIKRSPPKITVVEPQENGFSEQIGWMCMEPWGYNVKLYFIHNLPEFDIPYEQYVLKGTALEKSIKGIHNGFDITPKLMFSLMLWKDLEEKAKKRLVPEIIEQFLLRT